MTMAVMRAGGIGIRTILTSMILKPFLYVVVVVSAARAAGNGVVGKSIAGFNALLADFLHFFQNSRQHFVPSVALYRGSKQNCVIERRMCVFSAIMKEEGKHPDEADIWIDMRIYKTAANWGLKSDLRM